MKKFTLTSPVDSLELSCIVVEPARELPVKAVLQLSHGMCEHKERFVPVMEFLAAHGYVCIIHDHRGHGESVRRADDLGYMGRKGWDALIEDTKAVSDWIRAEYPGAKVVLFGHSMGSMVVRGFAKRYDDRINALFVCGSPSDNPVKGVGKALALAFGLVCGWHFRPGILQKLSFGTYNKPFASEKTPNAWVCSDAGTLEEYNHDPLCQYVFTADGFYNLVSLMQYCFSPHGWAMKNPQMPVHFISGALDPCRISDRALQKAVDLMVKVGYVNTDLKVYPGMRHEILNETEKLKVWNDILQMLEKI